MGNEMKALIIVFSPSGHTLQVAEHIQKMLVEKEAKVQLINITKNDAYLSYESIKKKLQEEVLEHDVVFIGGPIYAGHVEKHVLQVIEQLLAPNKRFGSLAVPFVTYGGVHSSIALEEMGKLLKKGHRKSLLGIKITAEHTLTKTYSNYINKGLPSKDEFEVVNNAVEKVMEFVKIGEKEITDVSKNFKYASMKERIIFHLLSQEAIHKKYKGNSIDYSKCIGCNNCVKACPINLFRVTENGIELSSDKDKCILCGECYFNCPVGAIKFPYLDRAKIRLEDGNAKMEEVQSKIYF